MDIQFDAAFESIVSKAKSLDKPARVVIAGADAENILKGVFAAQESGFADPILVGNYKKITEMLKKLGLSDKSFDLQPVTDDTNVVQYTIDMVRAGKADILMRGNTQTRDFLMPIINKGNHLLKSELLTHVSIVKAPNMAKPIFVSDVTMVIHPDNSDKVEIIKNMVHVMNALGIDDPKIAVLSLVETPSFHMRDTVEAQNLVRQNNRDRFADCTLVGPISYDLIMSKEAARLKNYDCPYCGEFDGICMPDLQSANLLVKVLQDCGAMTCGIIAGSNTPIAITGRSDSAENSYLSLAACAVLSEKYRKNA